MKKDFQLKQEEFENLLDWLSADREQAGRLYEEIRSGLMRYFRFRGCSGEDALTDETINRVAVKVSGRTPNGNSETINYFYGFAKNIYLEYLSQRRREVEFNPSLNHASSNQQAHSETENRQFNCLENCLSKLPDEERKLVVRYYSENKIAKIELRRKIAEELGLNVGTLHTKIYRLRNTLRKCIQKCINEK